MAAVGRLADRLLSAVLPKAAAGACPCNDTWCTSYGCTNGKYRRARANCDCSKVTYGPCNLSLC